MKFRDLLEVSGLVLAVLSPILALLGGAFMYILRNTAKDLISVHNDEEEAHTKAFKGCKEGENKTVDKIFAKIDEVKSDLDYIKGFLKRFGGG